MTMSEGFDPFADFGRTARLVQPHPLAPGGMQDRLESAAEAEGEPAAEAAPESGRRAAETSRAEVDILLPVVPSAELWKPLEPFRWLCKSLGMMRGRPLVFSGYGDAGKTFAAQELLLAIAAGRETFWGGQRLELHGIAGHFDFEQQLELTRWRYQRLAYGMDIDGPALGDRLQLVSLPPVYLNDPRMEALLIERCKGMAFALFDNLTAGTPGADENSKSMAEPLYMLNRVSAVTGCTMAVIHHERKAGELPTGAAQRMRGHSSIHGALGGGVSFSKRPDGSIMVEQAKSSLGEAEPVYFRFQDVGDVDQATGKSQGIRIEWVPVEQMAQETREAEDSEREAAFAAICERVFRCVQRKPGVGGTKPVAHTLKCREADVRAAFEALAAEGRIENRGGKPPRARWFAVSGEGSEGDVLCAASQGGRRGPGLSCRKGARKRARVSYTRGPLAGPLGAGSARLPFGPPWGRPAGRLRHDRRRAGWAGRGAGRAGRGV